MRRVELQVTRSRIFKPVLEEHSVTFYPRCTRRTRSWSHKARRHDPRTVWIARWNQARARVHAYSRQNSSRNQRVDQLESGVVVSVRSGNSRADDCRTNLLS